MTLLEMQIEQAAIDAEELAIELEAREAKGAVFMARGLRKLARDVRLSLVVEVSPEALTRLHLKLESAVRVAGAALLSTLGEKEEGPPQSQRPTIPPPATFSARVLFSKELEADEAVSERDRETIRPPAMSGVPPLTLSKVGVKRALPEPAPSEVRSVSGMRPKHRASMDDEDDLDDVAAPGSRRGR